jgi:hypothetical protein
MFWSASHARSQARVSAGGHPGASARSTSVPVYRHASAPERTHARMSAPDALTPTADTTDLHVCPSWDKGPSPWLNIDVSRIPFLLSTSRYPTICPNPR